MKSPNYKIVHNDEDKSFRMIGPIRYLCKMLIKIRGGLWIIEIQLWIIVALLILLLQK